MINYQGICGVNKKPVQLDETRPIVFIDIDGVINPVPYERKWIGPDDSGQAWYSGLYDPQNWEWIELKADPKLHYPISRQLSVEFDSWADQPQDYIDEYLEKTMPGMRYKKLRINLMDEMLDELRSLVTEYNVQFVYLTFWRSEALRLLESELQLGGISYLDWNTYSDRGHSLKIDSLAYFYEKTDIRTPFIVIDDEATTGLTGKNAKLWYFDKNYDKQYPGKAAQTKALNKIPKLILETDARWGIERKDVQNIRSFLENLKNC